MTARVISIYRLPKTHIPFAGLSGQGFGFVIPRYPLGGRIPPMFTLRWGKFYLDGSDHVAFTPSFGSTIVSSVFPPFNFLPLF